MALKFKRVVVAGSPIDDMGIWQAGSNHGDGLRHGFSFVITHESRSGPGFHGWTGYVASWRPLHRQGGAIKIGGSPFKTFDEAEQACNATLQYLTDDRSK